MASADDEPQSLRAIFDDAESKRLDLESTPATSPQYASQLESILTLYSRVLQQISAVTLFSPNEGVEDVGTSSLPYLLVDFYVADLISRTPFQSVPQRRLVLSRTRGAYERFLALVEGYGLVGPPYDKLLDRYRDDEEGFAVVVGGDAAAKRDSKIAGYKAEKQLRDKLESLRRNPRYLDHGDEELVRELHLTNVAFSIHSTFQALDSLNRELPILAQAPSPEDTAMRRNSSLDNADSRLDQPLRKSQPGGGPLLTQQGKPLQPFTLVGSRADRARGVFRPGHNLPTMSIDEYLEEERRRGGILEGGTEEAKPLVDEDDMEVADRETYKARDWDDFKDENPRGSGNTLNMG